MSFSLNFRLKKHYSSYEPTLQTLKHKYEVNKWDCLMTLFPMAGEGIKAELLVIKND